MAAVRCVRAGLPLLRRGRVGPDRQLLGSLDPAPEPDPPRLHGVEGGLDQRLEEPVQVARPRGDPGQHREPGHDRDGQLHRGPARHLRRARASTPTDPYDVMRWIDEDFHQPADSGGPGCPRRSPPWSPSRLARQRVRDRGQRQRRRRLGLRLMLSADGPGRGGHRPKTGLDDFGGTVVAGRPRRARRRRRRPRRTLTTGASRSSGMRLRMLLANRLRIEDILPDSPRHRRPGGRGTARDHRPAPHGDHRAQQTAGRRSADPVAAAVGVLRPGAAARVGDRGHDPRIDDAAAGARGHVRGVSPHAVAALPDGRPAPPSARTCSGMEFRTAHFDGMARVPSYTEWVLDCDMSPAYRYHRAGPAAAAVALPAPACGT